MSPNKIMEVKQMTKYQVYQHYEGSIVRTVEANSPDEAELKMANIDDITLDEMLNCNWDSPEVEEVEQ